MAKSGGGFIPAHGDYRKLLSYNKALVVYDATACFCNRFLRPMDRTTGQMVQAARSGKQNIVEGTMASGTSTEMELKLLGVARASLEELLEDYRDFLRTRSLTLWDKNSKEAQAVRRLAYGKRANGSHGSNGSNESYVTYEAYRPYIEQRGAEVVANIVICLIHQANYLLDRQIAQAERAFLKKGGIREQMTRARIDARNRPQRRREENET